MTMNLPQKPLIASNFISHEWIEGKSGTFPVESPYFGKVVGHYTEANQKQIQKALTNAQTAFIKWSSLTDKNRADYLFKLREIMLTRLNETAEIISLENGKTLEESIAGIKKGLEVLDYALSIQNLDQGGKKEVSSGVYCEYVREPIGVVAGITPFNFPAMVPMWMIPIALAVGNCFIWKPSEKTPLTSILIGEMIAAAGFPAGVFQVLQGGKDVVHALMTAKETKAIAFVGSTPIAKIVYETASKEGKRVLALGGAKNHNILLPDADPDIAIEGIRNSFTGCAGQRCMAASVLLTVGDAGEKFLPLIKKSCDELKLGHNMGAIITKEQKAFLEEKIQAAVDTGAELYLDGRNPSVPKDYSEGYWLGPTILTNCHPGMDAYKLELFGPVLTVINCKDFSEALEIQNSNSFGNAASIFTESGPLAAEFCKRAQAGMVGVNIGVPVPREPFSFGGVKDSKFGHGDITGDHVLNFWTDQKKVTTKWTTPKDKNWMN